MTNERITALKKEYPEISEPDFDHLESQGSNYAVVCNTAVYTGYFDHHGNAAHVATQIRWAWDDDNRRTKVG